ncbi:MAG TPA: SOS response-associated peptidase family protein [Steroidobacteraceae bacterium]|nr:SOS response-associated peptidase family protein [Steroidobacteraceae bacterium]
MCYSAMVEQHLRSLAREFRAEVDWDLFETLFRERLEHDDIKVSRALEANFTAAPTTTAEPEVERRIRSLIESHRRKRTESLERELFKQRKRLADARRSLEAQQTKRAREEERIAESKIESLLARLTDGKRTEPVEEDRRIFPLYFAPVIVQVKARRLVRPMRYTCRLPGKPASHDVSYPGTYNARRDNLHGFWSALYGRQHAILAITSFFENVPTHIFERRELAPGEKPKNLVLHFDPQPRAEMLVACLWAHWTGPSRDDAGVRELYSFAAITDEPPPEIASTGHNRCVVALKRSNVDEWLAPEGVSTERLNQILADRERPFYEHRIAA